MAASLAGACAMGQDLTPAARSRSVSVSALFPGSGPASAKQNSKSAAADVPSIIDTLFVPHGPPSVVPAAALESGDDSPPPESPPDTPRPPTHESPSLSKPIRILAIRAVPRAAPALVGLDNAMLSLTRHAPSPSR